MRSSQDELADEIRRYCIVNPHARDTLEGIAWWVVHQRYREMLGDLEAAIDRLVVEQVLVRHQMEDGATLYSCHLPGRSPSER